MSEEVLAKGRFRVDRRRALEKMEQFQLADPRAYTRELVAAAVAAGATRIDVRNDSDDFEIAWEGDGPGRDELDGLFDHLFSRPTTPRAEMLQHLAVGVLGALGQRPRWVRVDRGGATPLRLEVDDPASTLAAEHSHDAKGTRIHVRQRLSAKNLAEALFLPLRGAEETRFLREVARWCPVPVWLDGVLLAPPRLDGAPLALPDGAGALVLAREPGRRVDVVRRGVVVGSAERTVGPMSVAGWLRGDDLALDASRGNIMEDVAKVAFERALDEAVAELLAPLASAAPETPGLLDAAIWLAERKRALGRFSKVALLVDLAGRRWSADDLGALSGKKGTVDDPALGGVEGFVLFSAAERRVLDLLCPGLPDVTVAVRARAEGEARRRLAAATRLLPTFSEGDPHLAFTEGPLRGAIRFRKGSDLADLVVQLRVDGMAVQTIAIPSPCGAAEGILDHPGFQVDDAFRLVLDDETRRGALETLGDKAVAFATAHVESLARGAKLEPPAEIVLTAAARAAGAKARADLGQLLERRPGDTLLRAPAFSCGDGRRLGLPDVLAATRPWVLVDTLPRDCPPAFAAEVLVVPEAVLSTWLGWLGARARDGRATLSDDIRGAARRAVPSRAALLGPDVRVRVPVTVAGFTGELGLDGLALEARVDLLRAGIPVCTLTAPLGLLGVVGVLDHPTLEVNRAHDAPADPDVLKRLTAALATKVDELARATWDALPPGSEPPPLLLDWVSERGTRLPEWACSRTLAKTVAGDSVTATSLRARASDRRAARIKVLPHAPGDIPGFEDAIVATSTLRSALHAVASDALRGGEAELADASGHLARYLLRPAAEDPAVIAAREEQDGDVRVRWVLPVDPDRVGLVRVEARWRGRTLATRDQQRLGLLAIVDGRGIAPSASLQDLREPERLHAWLKKARTRFDDVALEALDALGKSGDVPEARRATWRALLARIEAANDRSRKETAIRDRIAALRLYTRLDGERVSRAEIANARAAGPVWHAPADTAPGPTDTPWYLRREPWTVESLGDLAAKVRDGGEALVAWREGEDRRRTLVRLQAVLTGATLAKAKLERPGERGEVALRPLGSGPDGLVVHPLVDGLPLEPLTLPFPAPAAAVIEGEAVRADRAFRAWLPGPEADAARAGLVEVARGLAGALMERVAAAGIEGAAPREAEWAVAFALGDRDGPGAGIPLFPVQGGGRVSAAALAERNRAGGVGIVRPDAPRFVAGEPPVVATGWLPERLATRFRLVDLAEVAARHTRPVPDPDAQHRVTLPDARVGRSDDTDAVAVCRRGVALATLPAGGPVPIVGWAEVPEADVDPLWKGLLPGCQGEVRRRLLELSRAVLARMMDDADAQGLARATASPLTTSLLAALDRVTADVRDDAALRALAQDPLHARLFALPLFRDCANAPGALSDVVARAPVRVVEPGVSGTPMASRGRVWALGPVERRIVGRLRKLQDATEALREETRGAARRHGMAGPTPRAPKDTRIEKVGIEDGGGELWLLDPKEAGPGVAVRVEGATVETISPIPGLAGWIEGPFETNAGFTAATLDEGAKAALRASAAALLEAEAKGRLARVHDRLALALAAAGHDLDALLDATLSPWAHVPILADSAGKPLDLHDLKAALKAKKRLVVGPPGAAPPRKGERVIAGDEATLAMLRGWLPEASIEHLEEDRARKDAKKKGDEARRAEGARGKLERAMVDRAGTLYARWTAGTAPVAAIEEAVRTWAQGGRPGWPPFDAADQEGKGAALIAFAVAMADRHLDPTRRLACVAGLAGALAG